VYVQAKPGTESSAHVDDALDACSIDQEHEVLRTQSGERVFDAEDVYVLCRLDVISVMLDLYGLKRQVMTQAVPSSAAQRHVLETGHKLAFGCCARGEEGLSRAARESRPGVSSDARDHA
jgi:hypothetical protein